jgi:predicted nucleic acid-binding Zn ribbon protein
MVAPPIEVCPVCGAHAERKISGGSGLIFKGSGFYITDYAKKNTSGTPAKSSSSESSSSSTTSTDKSS